MTHPLDPYRGPEQREALLDELARQAGGEVAVLGASVEGRPLRAARVPASGEAEGRVLCTANIHGPELIAAELALSLLRGLGQIGAPARQLRRRAEVWVIPCLNPDGYARTWEAGGQGSLRELRTNANGVDLNRNFPLPTSARSSGDRWEGTVDLPWAGSSRPGSPNYRGPSPLSEPEAAALDRLLRQQRFRASVNLHSFMGAVIPARVTDSQDYAAYRGLARRFRLAQSEHRYRRLASRWFDIFTGELEDHQHHALGCWAVCVELMTIGFSLRQHLRAPSLFWRFNPHDSRPWIDNDLPAVVAYLDAALDLPPPAVTAP